MSRGMTPEAVIVNIVRLRHAARRNPAAIDDLVLVIDDLRGLLDRAVSKATASRVLGVTPITLDKWIARGKIPVDPEPASIRRQVLCDPLIDIVQEVEELRELGETGHPLATALRNVEAAYAERRAFERRAADLVGPLDDPDDESSTRLDMHLTPWSR